MQQVETSVSVPTSGEGFPSEATAVVISPLDAHVGKAQSLQATERLQMLLDIGHYSNAELLSGSHLKLVPKLSGVQERPKSLVTLPKLRAIVWRQMLLSCQADSSSLA